jgi:hypothetical protein
MILGYELLSNPNFYGASTGWTLNAAWKYPTTGALDTTFVAATKKITRAAGSFVTDGFIAGNIIQTTSTTNPGPFTVSVVSALEITVSEAVVNEAESTQTTTLVSNYGMVNKCANGTTTLTQASGCVSGQQYVLRYQVSNLSAGQVTASVGGVSDTARTADGVYEKWFTATGTTALVFTPDNTARFSIDNVHLQRIISFKNPSFSTIPNIPCKGGFL